jgi:hypothetical protein
MSGVPYPVTVEIHWKFSGFGLELTSYISPQRRRGRRENNQLEKKLEPPMKNSVISVLLTYIFLKIFQDYFVAYFFSALSTSLRWERDVLKLPAHSKEPKE